MNYLLSIVTSLCLFTVLGQDLQTVHSITKERHELSWYEVQLNLWEAEVKKDASNPNAWYNYYSASRALFNLSETEEDRDKYADKGDEIAEQAYESVPNSFEANHIVWWNSRNDPGKLNFLMRAHEVKPSDARAFDDLMIHYEISGKKDKFKAMCNRIYEANELPGSFLNWGFNVLSELEKGAIVFTGGDNDTYALWIAQQAKKYRPDVTVLNAYLVAEKDEYRKSITDKLGLKELKLDKLDKDKFKKVFHHFLDNELNIPAYVNVCAIKMLESTDLMGDMYLTGLAYKYSKTSFDNTSVIRRNYEKRYLLDYLKEQFTVHPSDGIGVYFDATYLASMVKLYKLYQSSEERLKKEELEKLIIRISQASGQQSEINQLLSGEDESSVPYSRFKTELLDVKEIERGFLTLSDDDKFFMGAYEVSNEEYQLFLNNVLRSRQLDVFHTAIYDSSQWTEKFKYDYNEPMVSMYHSHPAYAKYPIVNVSYDGARAYCSWLTQQYNMQRKRTYTKVVFRLPTEKEWETAARGGLDSKTGIEGGVIKNEKGCYLMNIQPEKGRLFDDGAFHTAKVDSYLPNGKGFYNMLGNVAEMINEEGISKGGSWYSLIEDCYIDERGNYSKEDPEVGFRVVMEVIEK